jgi:prefoldin beta subunit
VLKTDDTIFKLIGPILVKQDLVEAKQNVDKRIDYIQAELKRHDAAIKDNESKQDDMKDVIMKIQQQLQQAKVKAAAKA